MASTYTYDDNSRREDLLDVITNLDYKENQLVSGLGTSTSKDILHQWLVDTLKTPGSNFYVESVDASYPATTNPTRLTNYCQIIRNGIQVSDTERSVNNAAFNDRYAYEVQKKLKEFKQDLEFAVMRGSLICGSGSAARQMKGIKNWVSISCSSSGTSLTENGLNDFLQEVWNNGTEVNSLYAPMYLKRKISGFTSGTTKYTDVTDRRLVNAVDVYQADAARMVKLFAHRYVTVSGDTNYDLVGINEDFFRIAYLRKPFVRELAKTGDATNGEVVGEQTLECLHQGSGFLLKAIL
jgi:hypothetical protein